MNKSSVDCPPELRLDPRKHFLFLHREILSHSLRADGSRWTPQTIFDHRLKGARLQLGYMKSGERYPPEEFPRMLMIGAGTGAEVLAAKERGYEAIGTGLLNDEQIAYARSRGVDYRLMDMHDLKFPNESFDVVYAKYSIEHCVNPWLVCLEVYAVLRDYGRWFMALDPYQEGTSGDDGPGGAHYMILPSWFMKPMFLRTGFKILWMEDSNRRYHYLLEKQPIDKIEMARKVRKPLLVKRLELGRAEYGMEVKEG